VGLTAREETTEESAFKRDSVPHKAERLFVL